jgi:hypothetical protein
MYWDRMLGNGSAEIERIERIVDGEVGKLNWDVLG